MYQGVRVAVVVPAFNEEELIAQTVTGIPGYVDLVLVVDDASTDRTAAAARAVERDGLEVITCPTNLGVGGAILTGHRRALELGADVCVVMAGDDQMDPQYLPALLDPIVHEGCGFTKGNRFFDLNSFQGMPKLRILGNVILSFMTKAASGYWRLFDPQNGYTAITRQSLTALPLDRIRHGYEFENDLLIYLNIARVRARDVPIPARYGAEVSGIRLTREIRRLSGLLFRGFWRRIWWKYVVQSFSPVALLLFSGMALFAFGAAVSLFVVVNSFGPQTASAATVLMAVAPLLTSINLLIFALLLDIQEEDR